MVSSTLCSENPAFKCRLLAPWLPSDSGHAMQVHVSQRNVQGWSRLFVFLKHIALEQESGSSIRIKGAFLYGVCMFGVFEATGDPPPLREWLK